MHRIRHLMQLLSFHVCRYHLIHLYKKLCYFIEQWLPIGYFKMCSCKALLLLLIESYLLPSLAMALSLPSLLSFPWHWIFWGYGPDWGMRGGEVFLCDFPCVSGGPCPLGSVWCWWYLPACRLPPRWCVPFSLGGIDIHPSFLCHRGIP